MRRTPETTVLARVITVCAATLVATACAIDFDSAIPCSDDSECPSDHFCDLAFSRCLPGEPTGGRVDTGGDDVGDAGDAGADDATDAASDDGRPPRDAGADDATEETGTPDTSDTTDEDAVTTDAADDGAGDACVPEEEVCNGEDDDCDGVPDNGLSCGGGGCGDGQALIEHTEGAAYCVDLYEASRPDATGEAAGTDGSRATSRPGVLPWAAATLDQARTACTAAGKRLCTEDEWKAACGGEARRTYPYSPTSYNPTACNGVEVAPVDRAAATGSFPTCTSPDGTVDMSGNLEEWTEAGTTRGGSFSDVQFNLRCNAPTGEVVDPGAANPAVGFRCCSDP